jgi:hypothetical protein
MDDVSNAWTMLVNNDGSTDNKQTAMKQLVLAIFPGCLNLRYRLVVCTVGKYSLITTALGIDSIPQSNEDISRL